MVNWQKFKQKSTEFGGVILAHGVFLLLLGLFFFRKLVLMTKKIKLNPEQLAERINQLMDRIDGKGEGEVSRIYLIELAIRNLASKKMRAIVTIGGMALGVGAVVFLVSLGYGLERLVISKVAKLDELRMIDVGMGEVASAKMDEGMMERISKMNGVNEVIPAVSMVAKVTYKDSVVDMMSMGIGERYAEVMGVKMLAGNGINDQVTSEQSTGMASNSGEVAGTEQEVRLATLGERLGGDLVTFNFGVDQIVELWKDCNQESGMLGYVVRQEGGYVGEKVWGERYTYGSDQGMLGKSVNGKAEYSVWIRTKAALWEKNGERVVKPMIVDNSYQNWGEGCLMEFEAIEDGNLKGYDSLDKYLQGGGKSISSGQVLGETTTASESAEIASASAELTSNTTTEASGSAGLTANNNIFEAVVATDSAGVEWVELKRVGIDDSKQKNLTFSSSPTGEAYISLGMLRIFGLTKDKVIGEKFGVNFIVPDGLIPNVSGRLESETANFKVAGVIDDDTNNYFYFHLTDAQKLGIKNYSQLKVVSKDQNLVSNIRKEIESTGLRTVSALDTVAEIEKLFRTLRLVLGLLGTIALAVAALGMFNTMTVSLLERTREVGVMKAMGMLSNDVRELFLAESMIMGVSGGVCGVTLGILSGKLVSIILTSVSIIKGQGAIDISYVPVFFTTFIVIISFLVGIITGWYPSWRARQISALNALRYE